MARPVSPIAFLLIAAAALAMACAAPAGDDSSDSTAAPTDRPTFKCAPDNGGITLPDDFCAVVFASDLGAPRHLGVTEDGVVYTSTLARRRRVDGAIVVDAPGGVIALRDSDGDGVADEREQFNQIPGTGVAVRAGYLYFSSDTEVWRVARAPGELLPAAEPELIVGGFPTQGQHAAKPITLDGAGNLYVTVGAPSNACQEAMRTPGSRGLDPCPQLEMYAGIWRFDADTPGQMHGTDGVRHAAGIRNAMGHDWNSQDGSLYAIQHGRDSLADLWGEMFTSEQSAEIPSEELFRISAGDDFGWPYCYYDPTLDRKVLAPEYGGDGSTEGRCAEVAPTVAAFPAHWAPNDLLFYAGGTFPARYEGGAFIAFHGSWNRMPHPQGGYNVVFVPFEGGVPGPDYEVFAEGFAGADEVMQPGQAAHRPTGLAQGPDGSLYIADDRGGRIWRVRSLDVR